VFSVVQNNLLLFVNPRSVEDRIAVRLASDGGTQVLSTKAQPVPQQRKAPAQERAKVPAKDRFDVECSWIGTC
jgi:D-alanyl-D-alanine carboxypeptidase/D-alanyl-D-alanine-endopeptidase (penicillin-binding protein 4)